jgi:tetratricopeptide (TPR) repeat protein
VFQFVCLFVHAQTETLSVPVVERYVVGYNDVTKMKFINDAQLYNEGWQNLPQPQFWQKIMLLSTDSAIVSVSGTRQMLDKISVSDWNKMSETEHSMYKEKLRTSNLLKDSSSILLTIGKKDFYDYKKALPFINRSIDVFKQNGVDPWYAQAILLIESPGKVNTKSGVGANGPFQLMKAVARKEGLIVNGKIDERTNVEKSAMGAARLLRTICIPYTKRILDSAHLTYNETDLWFRLLVLHSYHAGAGNVAGVIKKINPCEGGMGLIQQVWQTTWGGFRNASQNYSQLALAAFCNFDALVMQQKDSVFLIEGDRLFKAYASCKCTPYNDCDYLGNCIRTYQSDLLAGNIPFEYFAAKVKTVQTELSGIAPDVSSYADEQFNDIGFQLLKARKMDIAYKVFKLNETSFPSSWGVYHGLGQTCLMMGQKSQALEYYRKSIVLNPQNEEGLRAITQLTKK